MTGQAKRTPAMKWLRLYHEARTDAKLESLPDDEFRVWFRLLCFANEQPERGVIAHFSPRLLAVEVAHGDVALLQRTLVSLAELRIIETSDDAHAFLHWDKRQFVSDNVTARVLKHRGQLETEDETLQKRFSNGNVTFSDTDTDTDTDTEDVSSSEDSLSYLCADAPSQPSADALDLSDAKPARTPAKPRKTTPKKPAARPERPERPEAQPRPRNEWWDALVEVFGYEPMTATEKSKWGKVVKDVRETGATGADIRRAKANYDAGVASGAISWTLYPTSLSSHLGELLSAAPRAPTPSQPRAHSRQPVGAAAMAMASRPIRTVDDAVPEGY